MPLAAPCRWACGPPRRYRLLVTACSSTLSIPDGLAVRHHPHDALLRLRMREQAEEGFAFEGEDPRLVDQTSRFDVAAAHDLGDRFAEMKVVLGDESSFAEVDELSHDGGGAGAAGHGKALRSKRR